MDHRPIAPVEMFSVGRSNVNFYTGLSIYLRFEVNQFLLSQWQPRIEQALRATIDVHPRLRLQVDVSRSPAYFIVLPMSSFDILPLQIVEQIDHDDEEFLLKILDQESNTRFDHNQISPLWRVVLLFSSLHSSFTLILSFDHVIADGISGMAFFQTFVECLSKFPSSSSIFFSLADDRPLHEICPSNFPPLITLLSQFVEKLLLPRFLSRYFFPKTYWTGNVILSGDESNRTRTLIFKLIKPFIDLFHNKCQRERTTVHSALTAAVLLAIVKIFGDQQNRLELSCSSAINLRPYCQPMRSNSHMGVYISAIETYHYFSSGLNLLDKFWPLARQIREQIILGIRSEALTLIQMMKFVSNWDQFLLDQRQILPNGCLHSVDVSNLLRWSFENADWKILDGGFTQAANLVGSVFTASIVTINDTLTVHLTFQEALVPNFEQAKQLKETMKQFLIDIIIE